MAWLVPETGSTGSKGPGQAVGALARFLFFARAPAVHIQCGDNSPRPRRLASVVSTILTRLVIRITLPVFRQAITLFCERAIIIT